MPIADYQSLMLPTLKALADGADVPLGETRERIADREVTEEAAKQYAEGRVVGKGDLRNFAGAIDVVGTTKGVFVTPAVFTKSAPD